MDIICGQQMDQLMSTECIGRTYCSQNTKLESLVFMEDNSSNLPKQLSRYQHLIISRVPRLTNMLRKNEIDTFELLHTQSWSLLVDHTEEIFIVIVHFAHSKRVTFCTFSVVSIFNSSLLFVCRNSKVPLNPNQSIVIIYLWLLAYLKVGCYMMLVCDIF